MKLSWLRKTRQTPRSRLPSDFVHELIADVAVPRRGEDVRFFTRRRAAPPKLRSFGNRDLRESLLMLFYLAVATVVPIAWWDVICRRVARLRLKRHLRKEYAPYNAATRAVLGDDFDARGAFVSLLEALHRRRLMLAAHLVAPRWRPRIALEGMAGLQEALERGQGAIVWCDQFASQTVIGKRALFEAGLDTHQVSVVEHGISNTAFGVRFLNRPLLRVENRFLAGRIVFDREDARRVTARIQAVLKANGVVLMTNNIYSGTTFAEAAMGAGGWVQFASTPANFAARGKTALFSMATFETVPLREYRAVLSPALKPAEAQTSSAGGKNLEAQAELVLAKRDHLLAALKLYPEQMMVWARKGRITERDAQVAAEVGAGEP